MNQCLIVGGFTLIFIAYIIAFVKIAHRNELESMELERLTKGEKE